MSFRRKPHCVLLCQHSCFTTHHVLKAAAESNENSCKHEQEWGQAEQTCLRIKICFELSHDQALTHSCLLLRFLSTGGTTAKPLWFSYVELFFHHCPHRLCMGHGPATLLDVLIPLGVEFCNLFQRDCARTERECSRHVETITSMSSPWSSGDSVQ